MICKVKKWMTKDDGNEFEWLFDYFLFTYHFNIIIMIVLACSHCNVSSFTMRAYLLG
jgi:hypothetical protein